MYRIGYKLKMSVKTPKCHNKEHITYTTGYTNINKTES